MKKLALISLAASALLFNACGKKATEGADSLSHPPTVNHDANDEEAMVGLATPPHLIQDYVARGMRSLGSKLMVEIIKQSDGGNVNFSPWSIATALTLVSSAADGETKNELYELLEYNHVRGYENYHDRALQALNQHLAQAAILREQFSGDEVGSQLSFANGIWTNQRMGGLQANFQRLAQEYYAAQIASGDFASNPEASRQEINRWIASNTNNNLPEVLPVNFIKEATAAILVNAVAFKAAWDDEFSEHATRPGAFTTADGQTIQTPKMSRSLSGVPVVVNEDFTAFDLKYVGGQFVMTVVLPNEGRHAATQTRLLGDEGFANLPQIMEGAENQFVDLTLPKVKFDSSADIKQALEALGVSEPFGPRADFSHLLQGTSSLAISDILHKAFIEINEKGTDAAAATVVSIMVTSMPYRPEPKVIDVNRPFFYVIRDVKHSTPLFMGVVTDPSR